MPSDLIDQLEEILGYQLRVYSTTKGLRVLNPRKLLDLFVDRDRMLAVKHFRQLRTDDRYVEIALKNLEFAARISPKANRESEFIICGIEREGSTPENIEISSFIHAHDAFSIDTQWCKTWRSIVSNPENDYLRKETNEEVENFTSFF